MDISHAVFTSNKDIENYKHKVDIYDPNANANDLFKSYNIKLIKKIRKKYDYCLIAVRHKEFMKLTRKKINSYLKDKNFVYDLKGSLNFKLKNYERL